MNNKKIVKLIVEYKESGKTGRVTYENIYGIFSLELPEFDPATKIKMICDNGTDVSIDFRDFCMIKSGKANFLSKSMYKDIEMLLDGENYNFIISEVSVSDKKTPSISYVDATENILLGFPVLTAEIINGRDNGIWSDSGERLFVVTVKNMPFENDVDSVLEFTHFDEHEMYDPKPAAVIKKDGENVFLCSIDTKDFDIYMEPEKLKVSIKGNFVISGISDKSGTKISYEIPLSFVMNNSKYFDPKNKYICIDKNSKVSIDFGTSSTCAAIKTNIVSMIEMSPDIDGSSAYSVYENPTNLMMYRWKEFKEKWNAVTVQPLMRKVGEDYPQYSPASFDFGHPVKDIQIDNQRKLDSIIKQLKMIPKMIKDGKEIKVRDYANTDEFELTSDKTNSENVFNPIEFYGYLLGKAINHPNGTKNCFYTKYLLSYPVKFSEEIRKQIEDALTRGIKRSLPASVCELKDDKGKDLLQVKMKYSEPIACIGAACDEELVLTDGNPCLFGVFDFGGGTSDYSFGMYRQADIDTEGYEEAIELFGVDGDESFGGELIMSKISYWILTSPDMGNKFTIIEKSVPFEKPEDELIEDGFGNLIQNTIGAIANIRKLNELVARPFFEGKKLSATYESGSIFNEDPQTGRVGYCGITSIEIDMFVLGSDNETEPVTLNINFDTLNQKLEELFKKKCRAFAVSMDKAFNLTESKEKMEKAGVEYKKSAVKIIMSGNSSRHPLIKRCLSDEFKENDICLLGENRVDNGKNRYRVTPKTAVAIGALRLEQMLVNEPATISIIYVAIEVKSKREIILSGDLKDHIWKRVGVVTDGSVTIYKSSIPDVNSKLLWEGIALEFEEFDTRMVCYIRQCGRDEIEYTAVPVGVDPNNMDIEELEILKEKLN